MMMNTQLKQFGQIVKERRTFLGYTQRGLGRQAGCAAITIRKIEAGSLRPSVQLARLLAQALEVPEIEQKGFILLSRGTQALTTIPYSKADNRSRLK